MKKATDKKKKFEGTHSTTIYITRANNGFKVKAIKERARQLGYSVSAYHRWLYNRDLVSTGLINSHDEPNWEVLEKITQENSKKSVIDIEDPTPKKTK